MDFAAVIFLACIAVQSGFSSDPAINRRPLSGSIPASEKLVTCPRNSSISVKVLRSLQGEWMTTFVARSKLRNNSRSLDVNVQKDIVECNGSKYLSVSGFLIDKDAEDFSEVFVGEHEDISGGEDRNSGRENIQSPMKSDRIGENLNIAKKSSERMGKIENRLDSLENTLQSFNETIHQMRNILKNMPDNGYYMHFDDIIMGEKIVLRDNLRTAIRETPRDHDGYGGVLSSIPLRDDVPFEIRIDETIDKFTEFGIPLGFIVKKQVAVTNTKYLCRSLRGTYCIWSYSDATKGTSHIFKDGSKINASGYTLDTRGLAVGTTIGLVRRSNNALHFLLNGSDRGVAFENVQDSVYAFVDIADYISKISIIS